LPYLYGLEQHVALLQRLQQPVPQTVALLLTEAQRKEKKKTAKRAANRKSASTSRARKKALVEEITRANARLKRQAMILSLLPDLVIATTMEGEISFCSAQVERILGHNPDDLVGIKFDRILTPSSREILQKLFSRLAHPNKTISTRAPQGSRRGAKRRHEQKEGGDTSSRKDGGDSKGTDAPGRESSSGDGDSGNSGTTSGAAIISEQSFPLAIVEVESKQGPKTASTKNSRLTGNENSDNSTSNNSGSNNTSNGSKQHVSSLSNATGMSPTDSPDEDEGAGQADSTASKRAKTCKKGKRTGKSDDSSLSSEAKKASDNLDRNVRRHNQRMLDGSQKSQSDHGPKDDVIGESVTANNASARLSSLKHIPSPAPKKNDENDQSSSDDSLLAGVEEGKKVENQSDDSGYRESNDSREEESSSGSDSSNAKKSMSYRPRQKACILPRLFHFSHLVSLY
jgi:PAS domain-containing protein